MSDAPLPSSDADGLGTSSSSEHDLRQELEVLRTRLAAASEDVPLELPSPLVLSRQLLALASTARPFVLEPRALFVAWSGVLTLAYAGWPPEAAAAKARLESGLGAALAPEQPGSRWPKTTLGALRDDRTLDLGELERLVHVLDKFTSQICGSGWHAEAHELSLTFFKCTGHERLFARQALPLAGGPLDEAAPGEAARRYSEEVLAEAADLAAYLPHVQRAGSNESKYRAFRPGASLVVFAQPPADWLASLQAAVDGALPGAYAWLEPGSLHCTLRGLI